jgi:spermidine/putrescine-binding protein
MKLFVLSALCLILAMSGCGKRGSQLNLYIWSEYIPQSVLDKFTQRTGIKVNVDTYDSNETLLSKLDSGVAGYDLCVPTDYMIRILITQKLIQPIDPAKVPNLKNIDKRFLGRSFDPGNKYCVPYLWGTTGLGYNKQRVSGTVDSWRVLFDEKYSGKILMLDDMRECFTVALKVMGKSLNTTDEPTLREAAAMLKNQARLVKTYNSNDYDNNLKSGDVVLAHGYNGQIAKLAAAEPDKFAYVIPKEGGTVSMDALCIPVRAKNVEAALAFINFVHEPEINAEIVNNVNYASTNEGARKHIKPEILNNPWIYPPQEALKNCEFMEDPGAAMELLDKLWTEIKAK